MVVVNFKLCNLFLKTMVFNTLKLPFTHPNTIALLTSTLPRCWNWAFPSTHFFFTLILLVLCLPNHFLPHKLPSHTSIGTQIPIWEIISKSTTLLWGFLGAYSFLGLNLTPNTNWKLSQNLAFFLPTPIIKVLISVITQFLKGYFYLIMCNLLSISFLRDLKTRLYLPCHLP